ncbi:MAG: glycosyltransferase [Candidatus Hydrogenedentota bacterium]
MAPKPISIIIPAFNQLDYCRQCIESLHINTDRAYRLILVDNGSTDGVSEFFDSVPDAVVVHSETNRGFAGGVNLGLDHADGHVLLLNSDTLVPRGWLGVLERALLQKSDIGMVGPMSNCVSGPQHIPELEFTSLDEINAYAAHRAREHKDRCQDVDRLVGFCLLIREETVQQVGRFDVSFGPGNFEDDDYCLRVRRAGYRLGIAQDAFVFHYGNRTFLGMGIVGDRWDKLMTANQRKFIQKWNLEPPERKEAVQESQRLNARARQAFEQGDIREALELLRQAIVVCPWWEVNFNDLGVILWEVERHEDAYQQFLRAIQLNAAFEDARANLRQAAEVLGKTNEAHTALGETQNRKNGD